MPAIARFYGIIILMHLTRKEHTPPHIHALYGDYEALFAIDDGRILQGKFPGKEKPWSKNSSHFTERNSRICGTPKLTRSSHL